MKKYFIYFIATFFIFGCAATSEVKPNKNVEVKEYSSVFYAIRLTSEDNWRSAYVIDSEDNEYNLKRQNSANGILLKDDKINIHIKDQFALFQNEHGEMVLLEEAK